MNHSDKFVNKPGSTELFKNDSTNYELRLIDDKILRLTVKSVDENDVGLYKCADFFRPNNDSAAELIVIDKGPTCNMTRDSYQYLLTCEITYSGCWTPQLQWTWDDGSVSNDNVSCTDWNGTVVRMCSLEINLTTSRKGLPRCSVIFTSGGFSEICHTKSGRNIARYDQSLPVYNESCTYHSEQSSVVEEFGLQLVIICVGIAMLLLIVETFAVLLCWIKKGNKKQPISPDLIPPHDSKLSKEQHNVESTDFKEAEGLIYKMDTYPRDRCVVSVSQQDLPVSNTQQSQTVGADGTIYVQLDVAARLASYENGVLPPLPLSLQAVKESDYAFIDHTRR